MPKYTDITGCTYNNLTVLSLLDYKAKNGALLWLCKCSCGNTVIAEAYALKTNHTKSCGCLKYKYEDLSGKRYGKLLVIERGSNKADISWKCLCDCGNMCEVTSSNLKNTTSSCGCYRREKLRKDLTGNRYGRLLVLERAYLTRNKKYTWKCLCDCGTVVYVLGNSLQMHKTVSCGCRRKTVYIETSRNYRIKKGKDPNISMLEGKQLLRAKLAVSGIKQKILNRDKYCCCLCGIKTPGCFAVHHIIPLQEDESLAFDEKNLITLCNVCHKKAHDNVWCKLNIDIQQKLKEKISEFYG